MNVHAVCCLNQYLTIFYIIFTAGRYAYRGLRLLVIVNLSVYPSAICLSHSWIVPTWFDLQWFGRRHMVSTLRAVQVGAKQSASDTGANFHLNP